jgi:asparagine synthase (glutamine-hydrolysing)
LKLPAGHYAIYKDGRLDIKEYWDLKFPSRQHRFDANEAELAAELRERFTASVKAQMLSDVPLGAFLSAGLDSSSIVAAMAQSSANPVRTYTIAFPDKYRRGELTLDDTRVARRTAEHFGCLHTEIIVEPDVVDLLPKLVYHMDEPVADPAIITAYLVNREARKTVTVLLSGVGGDELFAGYRKHQAHALAEQYRKVPAVVRRKIVEPAVLALPAMRGTPVKGYVRLAKKMARSGSLSPRDRFLMDSTYLTEHHLKLLYSPEARERIYGDPPINGDHAWSRHLEYFDRVEHAEFLNQMLYLDTKAFMVSLNLTYNDKMSMASSVEVRVPFLDWELAEWVAGNVPPDLKLHKGTTKHILREAVRPLVPREVLEQKKAGFGAPADYWLAHDLREMVDDLLGERRLRERGLFDPAAVRLFVDEQRSGREDWSLQLWQFLTLELWMQAFID